MFKDEQRLRKRFLVYEGEIFFDVRNLLASVSVCSENSDD